MDKTDLIQALVDRADMDWNVRHHLLKIGNPFGRGDQRQQLEPGDTGRFQNLAGSDRRSPCGQHGIDEKRERHAGTIGKLVVVLRGLERTFVSEEADVPDLGVWKEVEQALAHPEAGSEDWHNADDIRQPSNASLAEWSLNLRLNRRQIAGGFVGQLMRQASNQFAKFGRTRSDVPQQRKLMLNHGM
jgi:hypothetical protein